MAPKPRPLVATALFMVLALAACGSNDAQSSSNTTTPNTAAPTSTTTVALENDSSTESSTTSIVAEETTSDPSEATVTTDPPPAVADILTGSMIAPDGQRTVWTGAIDGEIELSIWLAQKDGYLRGELTYLTSGQPITVLGRAYRDGTGYFLHEFGDDGKVSGTLILGNVASGEISNASWGDRDLSLTFAEVGNEPYFFDPLARSGVYTYAFGPFGDDDVCCGPTGYMQISALTDSSLLLSIENVTSGPGFNLASVEPTEIPLVNNVASYELSDEFTDCAFDITIFDGFAFVDYVDDRFDCLFGNAAGVEGIYLRTGTVVEPEDSPFFNALLTSTNFGTVGLGDTWSSLTDRFDVPPHNEADDFFGPGCYYVRISNDSLSPWFMMLGDGDEAVVSRIEPTLPDQRAESGLGVGDTEADVDAFYGDAVQKDPHQYLGDGAKYLRITPAGDATSTILFETNEAGEITSVRNGYLEPIRWVEGCA